MTAARRCSRRPPPTAPTSRRPSTRRVQDAAEKALADSKLTVPGAVVAVDVQERRGAGRRQQPDQRVRPGAHRALPAGVDLQGGDELRLPDPGHHHAVGEGAVPGIRHGRRPRRSPTSPASRSAASPTFFQDFTISCNTAFVGLSDKLGDERPHDGGEGPRHRRRLGRHPRRQRHLRRQRADHHRRHRHRGGLDRPGPRRGLAGGARGDGRQRRAWHLRAAGARQGPTAGRPGRWPSTARRWRSCAR